MLFHVPMGSDVTFRLGSDALSVSAHGIIQQFAALTDALDAETARAADATAELVTTMYSELDSLSKSLKEHVAAVTGDLTSHINGRLVSSPVFVLQLHTIESKDEHILNELLRTPPLPP